MLKKVFFASLILIGIAILARLLAPSWYQFLAANQPIEDAEVLLVEGWVSESTLKHAAQIFKEGNYSKIIVASILFPNEYQIASSGTLVFNINTNTQYKELIIKAHSEKVKGEYAKMMIMVNQDTLSEIETEAQPKKYTFPLSGQQQEIQQVKITFLNDYYDKGADRNLMLDSLYLDNTFIPNRTQKVYFDRGEADGLKTEAAYTSRAGSSADYLIAQGVPQKAIFTIDAPRVEYNKTYTTAKAVAKWIDENHLQEEKMNLISENVHSRRSWMLFKKAFPNDIKVGIIASSRFENDENKWWKNRGRRAYVMNQTLKFWYAILSYFFV